MFWVGFLFLVPLGGHGSRGYATWDPATHAHTAQSASPCPSREYPTASYDLGCVCAIGREGGCLPRVAMHPLDPPQCNSYTTSVASAHVAISPHFPQFPPHFPREASGSMQDAADNREQRMGDQEKMHIEMNRPGHNHRQGVGQLEAHKRCVST